MRMILTESSAGPVLTSYIAFDYLPARTASLYRLVCQDLIATELGASINSSRILRCWTSIVTHLHASNPPHHLSVPTTSLF